MKNTKVISGFHAVGKSYLFNNKSDLLVLDSDSSDFSWISEGVRHPDFPNNYIKHIIDNIGQADIILVSSHDVVRKALQENNIKYTLVYPDKLLKDEYIQRFEDRGDGEPFLDFFNTKWDEFIDDMENETFPEKIKLTNGQHLKDVI